MRSHSCLLPLLLASVLVLSLPAPARCRRVSRACFRKKKSEMRSYIKCAWLFDHSGSGGKKKSKDLKNERMDQCGAAIPKGRGAGKKKCSVEGVTAPAAERLFGLCGAGGLSRKQCNKFSAKYVGLLAGRGKTKDGGKEEETPTDLGGDETEEVATAGFRRHMPFYIREFDTSVVDGYTLCSEFEEDIAAALTMLANSVITENAERFDQKGYREEVFLAEPMLDEAEEQEGDETQEEEDSFGTNNQEAGVDEGDVVKVRADGGVVFAAYGNLILCWDAVTGVMLCRTKIPRTEKVDGEPNGNFHNCYKKTATVRSLLLNGDRLVAVIDTGCSSYWCWYCPYEEGETPEPSILSDYGTIQVRIYNISEGSIPGADAVAREDDEEMALELLRKSDLQGYYMDSRSIGSVAHIVTASNVRHHLFTQALSRWHSKYEGMNKTEYIEAAVATAEELIPPFSRQLAQEVLGENGTCDSANVMKISSFGMAGSGNETDSAPDLTDGQGILNQFVRINSFDMARNFAAEEEEAGEEGALPPLAAEAGAFLPTHWAEVYASETTLVLGGRGYHSTGPWPFGTWEEYTYLVALKLKADGTAADGHAIGTVTGYTLNQFAMDEHRGYLRVATTSNAKTECINWTNYTSDFGYVYHWCRDWVTTSNSTSQVTVLKLPDAGNASQKMEYAGNASQKMEFVSSIDKLGETERIFAVRFFDDRAFVVTFLVTDPLFSIDFKDPEKPVLADELKITGFGRYLHPIGTEMLLAVGQEAHNKTGRALGLQVTLFNVSDLYDISLLQKYTIEDSSGSSSSSEAEHDHHAMRYLPQSKWLILPGHVHNYKQKEKNFDGFLILKVEASGIEQLFNVSMADPNEINGGCYYYASMPSRVLVFKGNGTFIKRHSYQSWDIDKETKRWNYTLDGNLEEEDCEPYWRYPNIFIDE